MAQKQVDPTLKVADIISDNMGTTARKYRDKAPNDKSYFTTICGVNRKFTDDVPNGEQSNIIKRYSIPETIEANELNFYTVKLNEGYYTTKQVGSFKLYDHVMAYLPNANFSRFYLDYPVIGEQEKKVTIPQTIVSETEPEGEFNEGDWWDKIDSDGNIVTVYCYLPSSDTGKLGWILQYTVASSGVGEFVNDDHNSERFNDYTDNETAGSYDHIEGKNNESLSEPYSPPLIPDLTLETVNHMEGLDNSIAAGVRVSHVAGERNTLGAGSYACDIGGYNNTVGQGNNLVFVRGLLNNVSNSSKTFVYCDSATAASADCSFVAGGYGNNISGTQGCLASGYGNNCSGARYSMVGGQDNIVSGYRDLVGGYGNTVRGECDLAAGQHNTVVGYDSAALGYDLTNTKNYCLMCGHEGSTASLGNVLFVVANSGIAFYIDDNGAAYAAGGYHAIGADYAEYFEWADGNSEGEDRRGMLVSLEGDKIVLANTDDILGAVSARPSVVGNAYEEHWRGKYRTDAFGGYVLDENGQKIISDDFDPDRKYIPRSQRPEWAAVGMTGRLIVTDDGRCTPGGYISARRGIAVPILAITNVRMLRRVDNIHIEVLIK